MERRNWSYSLPALLPSRIKVSERRQLKEHLLNEEGPFADLKKES